MDFWILFSELRIFGSRKGNGDSILKILAVNKLPEIDRYGVASGGNGSGVDVARVVTKNFLVGMLFDFL